MPDVVKKITFPSLQENDELPAKEVGCEVHKGHRHLDLLQRRAFGSRGLGISMEAFLVVKPAAGEEGSFRFVLDGPEKLNLKFNVQSVLPSGIFSDMVAEAELHVGQHIKMQKNSCCSEWMDVAELVRSQDIRISNRLGKDAGEEFLHGMESYKKDLTQETGKADRAGIRFRWILGTLGGDKRVKLIAHVIFISEFRNFSNS